MIQQGSQSNTIDESGKDALPGKGVTAPEATTSAAPATGEEIDPEQQILNRVMEFDFLIQFVRGDPMNADMCAVLHDERAAYQRMSEEIKSVAQSMHASMWSDVPEIVLIGRIMRLFGKQLSGSSLIQTIMAALEQRNATEASAPDIVIYAAVYYLFAVHAELDAFGRDAIGDEYFRELESVAQQMERIFNEHPKQYDTVTEIAREYMETVKPHSAKGVTNYLVALDKLNTTLAKDIPRKGIIKTGSAEKAGIYYCITGMPDDDGKTKLTRPLTPLQVRAIGAFGSIQRSAQCGDLAYVECNFKVLAHAMGYTSAINSRQRSEIIKAITRAQTTGIRIINDGEIAAQYKYKHVAINSIVLDVEVIEGIDDDGKTVDVTFKIKGLPLLIKFAEDRKQLTSYSLKTIQSKASKTETQLQIEQYVMQRIGRENSNKAGRIASVERLTRKGESRTAAESKELEKLKKELAAPAAILYETLYAEFKLTDKVKDKQKRIRLKNATAEFLKWMIECGDIQSFQPGKNGFKIVLK